MECLFSLRLQYRTDLPLRPLQYYEYVIGKRSISVKFSTQFITNVIAPLAKAVAVNLPGPRITANHRECAPLQGKSISDGFTWRRTGRVHSWGECREFPNPHLSWTRLFILFTRAHCTSGRVQSRRSSEEVTMLSKPYTRAAWAARPLAATCHLRIAPMSSSVVGGKVNGEWRVRRGSSANQYVRDPRVCYLRHWPDHW